jgi:single-stranded-DNA-specific exonuclease
VIAPRLEWLLPEPIPSPPPFAGFGPAVSTLLARRGFRDETQLRGFLEAGAETFHPIELMADASRALERIGAAVDAGERIAVWGDYDADGMTAVAVWMLALRALGAEPTRYIPSRLAEGYGLSVSGLSRLRAEGVTLVVTCDCGIANVEEVDAARALGIDVVVTDHHLPGERLPAAVAVVDPHRPDCPYPDLDLTGAGLAYRLASTLLARRDLHVEGLAAIAAIGTVADVAPMTGESRTLVRLGLGELAATRRPGLRALLARGAEDANAPSARDLAFGIAPRINAAGRIAECELAISLLLADDPGAAERIADELEEVHRRRRQMTAVAVEQARHAAADDDSLTPLVLRADEWAPGILGLVAGRLSEALGRPVAAAALVENEVRGSVRAPADFHVAEALSACAAHLVKRGGHAAAGGFSCRPEAWPVFAALFGALPRPFPVGAATVVGVHALIVDLVLPASHLGWQLYAELTRLAPWGPGNPEPMLAVTGLRVVEARRVGDGRHVSFRLRRGAETFDAIAFGTPAERPLPDPEAPIDLVGTLQRDRHDGTERLRLRVADYAESAASPLIARRRPRLLAAS